MRGRVKGPAISIAMLVLTLSLMANLGFFETSRWGRGIPNILSFTSGLFPPDPAVLEQVAYAILETIQMAFVGTLLGLVASLPLGLLGARNIFGGAVSAATRLLLGVVRTIPSLLWALIFVVAFGLGPFPGTVGLAAYTVGYLGKLYYEAFEAVDPEVLEATRAIGLSRLQQIRYVVVPETLNQVLSQLLFMFEYNVRASSILGFVGAGGIGIYMLGYLQLFQYNRLLTTLLVTLAVVLAIDFFSVRARDRFLMHAPR